jgi:glycosyltransferase involved in cell wall biosynthesis
MLYRHADLLAYLSEEEGFGLPMLEAMRSGTAVLTLDRPVAREVAGDAAHYLPQASVESIRAALILLLRDLPARQTLAAGGLRRAADFDWQQTARETARILAAVATAAPRPL